MKNDNTKSTKATRCQTSVDQIGMCRATGTIHHPAIRSLLHISNCQLAKGKYADKAHAMIDRIVTPMFLAQQYAPQKPAKIPAVPAKYAILLGHEVKTGRPIIIHRNSLIHTLIAGSVGTGKSRTMYSIVAQVMAQNKCGTTNVKTVRIHIKDFKGEAKRFFSLFPDDTAIFRAGQVPRNILEAQGHARTYYHGLFGVIQRYSNLRPETWTELPGFLIRMDKSRKPGQPPPSLVDLERALRKTAAKEDRPNLLTAARAVATLIEIYQESSRIRTLRNHSVTMNRLIDITLYDTYSSRAAELLVKLDFLANSVTSTAPGEQRELSDLPVLEDALSVLAGEQTAGISGAESSPIVQALLLGGWMGHGVVAITQAISPLPNIILNNFRTFMFTRLPLEHEAVLAVKLANGPKELVPIVQRLADRHLLCYSVGFEGPIIAQTPEILTGACPTDEEIDCRMAPIFADIRSNLVLSPKFDDAIPPICYLEEDEAVQNTETSTQEPMPQPNTPEAIKEYVRFLSMVASNEHLSARELTAALNMSAGKATKLKAQLATQGFVTIRQEPGETGRPRSIVTITPKGLELLKTGGVSK